MHVRILEKKSPCDHESIKSERTALKNLLEKWLNENLHGFASCTFQHIKADDIKNTTYTLAKSPTNS